MDKATLAKNQLIKWEDMGLTAYNELTRERRGIEEAKIRYLSLLRSGLQIEELTPEIAKEAGLIKCKHKNIPMGDCIIASTAKIVKAKVLSDDPHYDLIKEIKLDWIIMLEHQTYFDEKTALFKEDSMNRKLNLEDKDILVKINRVMKSGLDGDGWISTEDAKNQKRKEFSVGFSNGNREFMKNLVGNLHERLNLTINNLRKKTKITKNGRKSITYQTEWYATNAYKIIKFLYDNLKEGELYLERKYESQLKARRIYERTRKPILWRKIEDEYGMPMKSLLHEMLIEGDSNGVQIAKKLGVHSSTVYRWLAETKVRLPKKKQRKVTIKKCPICNNWFKRWGRYPKKYCSDRCRTFARRTGKTVQCAVCSKEIYRPRWWFKINTTPICSQECMRKWQRIRVENNIIPRSRKTGQFLPSKRTIS